jgi:multicomponent Na+:H+ antiporter subunit E
MTATSERQVLGSWAARGLGYFAFWVLLIGVEPADLLVGLATAAVATRISLVLLPPGEYRLRLAGLPRYTWHFLWQSAVAGVDVARRAFAPDMRLQPGLVAYDCPYPRGAKRNAFASLTSLLPGTVSVRDDAHGLYYHCLDTTQPIVQQLDSEKLALDGLLPRKQRS